MKLKLSELASIAEIIGAVAVVISLLYVGIQVNENTSEVRAANRQELVNRSFTATLTAATHPELAGAFEKVAEGEPLTSMELAQFGYFIRSMLYDIQEAYLLYQEDRLDEEYWTTRSAIAIAYMRGMPARDIYHRDRELGTLHASFVEWMDQAIQERYSE